MALRRACESIRRINLTNINIVQKFVSMNDSPTSFHSKIPLPLYSQHLFYVNFLLNISTSLISNLLLIISMHDMKILSLNISCCES